MEKQTIQEQWQSLKGWLMWASVTVNGFVPFHWLTWYMKKLRLKRVSPCFTNRFTTMVRNEDLPSRNCIHARWIRCSFVPFLSSWRNVTWPLVTTCWSLKFLGMEIWDCKYQACLHSQTFLPEPFKCLTFDEEDPHVHREPHSLLQSLRFLPRPDLSEVHLFF